MHLAGNILILYSKIVSVRTIASMLALIYAICSAIYIAFDISVRDIVSLPLYFHRYTQRMYDEKFARVDFDLNVWYHYSIINRKNQFVCNKITPFARYIISVAKKVYFIRTAHNFVIVWFVLLLLSLQYLSEMCNKLWRRLLQI